MRGARGLITFVAAIGLVAWTAPGCGNGDAATTSSSGAGGGCSTYQCSDCGKCVTTSCSNDLATCNADPECASYASCVFACPVGKDGNVDPSCVSGCPLGSSTASQKAAEAFLACREKGPGVSCAACNVMLAPPPTNELLNQMCGSSTETNPCFKCEDEKCCDTEAAAMNEPDRSAYVTCISACTGDKSAMQTCQYQCDLQHKVGALVEARLFACMEYYCAVDVVSPPAMKPCDENERTNCQKCQYETCGDQYANLVETQDGMLLQDCDIACPFSDTNCEMACLSMYPSAQTAFFAYGDCLTQACSVCM